MVESISQPDGGEQLGSLPTLLLGDARRQERDDDVLHGGEVLDQVERLEDETDRERR